jgi:oligopeptide transport system permease protein
MSTSAALRQFAVELARSRVVMVSTGVLVVMAIIAVLGPQFSPHSYIAIDLAGRLAPPAVEGWRLFGSDDLGRDLFVRTAMGLQVTLLVAMIASLVSLVIGVVYGAIAGYVGGKVDAVMMRFVDALYALPFIFLVILLMVVFERNFVLIFVAIGAINWLDMARIVRGQTLSLKNMEFVEAARACGVDNRSIILRHIMPNLLGVVMVYISLTIPQVILVESFLSFLGLGVQEPMSSWGALVNDGAQDMESAPWTLVFPATFLTVTLYCFNYIGDGLRDALDPKDRS